MTITPTVEEEEEEPKITTTISLTSTQEQKEDYIKKLYDKYGCDIRAVGTLLGWSNHTVRKFLKSRQVRERKRRLLASAPQGANTSTPISTKTKNKRGRPKKPLSLMEKWIAEACDISSCFDGTDDKMPDFDYLEVETKKIVRNSK